MKLVSVVLFLCLSLFAKELQVTDAELKKMIGHMLVVGFDDSNVTAKSKIIEDINTYELGGVILFDIFYSNRSKNKNIFSPQQLKKLTSDLQQLTKRNIIISVDQEGGKVARLKPKYGFDGFPSAKEISQTSPLQATKTYLNMSKMLQESGINCNFAPVVDLEVNPENVVIVGLERSFGNSSAHVSQYANILINAQKEHNITSVLKHFPGHGSSLGDSHLGFVDVSHTWSKRELEPYQSLIDSKQVEMIMTAHVFNSHLDKNYPATLSHNVNTKLLREAMNYQGVVVSDDLQMKAISSHYSLKETVTLAINAGVDILLFGNQLATHNTNELIKTIFKQVKNNSICLSRIIESNKRIQKLHE